MSRRLFRMAWASQAYTIGVEVFETFIFPSRWHFKVKAVVSHKTNSEHQPKRACVMDEYQEELLEYQAFELDPLEPADDATEL
jgi:hypothetical protein